MHRVSYATGMELNDPNVYAQACAAEVLNKFITHEAGGEYCFEPGTGHKMIPPRVHDALEGYTRRTLSQGWKVYSSRAAALGALADAYLKLIREE